MKRMKVNLLKDQLTNIEMKFPFLKNVNFKKIDESLSGGVDKKDIDIFNKRHLGDFDMYLDPSVDGIYILDEIENKQEVILYHQIDYVVLSICSRRAGRYNNRYQIDVDIVTKDKTYLFEVFNPNSFQDLINQLTSHQIECIDMVGVIKLYQDYPSVEARSLYLDTHFNELAKKYQLDHPRFQEKNDYKDSLDYMKNMYQKNIKK